MTKNLPSILYFNTRKLSINVTDGRLCASTGPLACLSPFSVIPWIRSDKCPNLRSASPMFRLSRIKVPNKISHKATV